MLKISHKKTSAESTKTSPLHFQPSSTGIQPVVWALLFFILSILIAVLLKPSVWTTFWTSPRRTFDLEFYLGIADQGYAEVAWPAFYPGWPLLLAACKRLFSLSDLLPFAHALSFAIYAAATAILYKFAAKLTNQTSAAWMITLMTLNPNSIFHGLAYSESLFSLVAGMFLISLYRSIQLPIALNICLLSLSSALLAITRPILPQILATGIATVTILAYLPASRAAFKIKKTRFLGIFAAMICSCIVSYIPFGMYCYEKFGNFFHPYWAQSLWKRSLGLYWPLIFKPETVGGSDNVLVWDLIAFYAPAFMLVQFTLSLRKETPESRDDGLAKLTIFLFSILFAGTHAGIAFLSYPIFMSLGRHVLATPFFFFGSLITISYAAKSNVGRKTLAATTLISFAYLVNFWIRFGRSAWIG